ncbi:glutamate--tRNA ligase family protein [Paraflavitalea soli]|nr:glutamate--tRNA ligase family protein [Paraflavitalea soli]
MAGELHFNRTRIAPTPSGFLHLGNVLSFVITVAWARKTGASILLRIDDLDRERYQPRYVQDIFDTLYFLELPWDEGPRDLTDFEQHYSQVHRLPLYQEALQVLGNHGPVYTCTCSRSTIHGVTTNSAYPGTCRNKYYPLDTAQANWRLYTGDSKPLEIRTLPQGTMTTTLPPSMEDFVVRKKDGMPAYQLTSIVDDLHFGVDLIVRGADLWPCTIAQHYLASQLPANSFHQTAFFHHALLTNAAGAKLSKSAGDTSIQSLRKGHNNSSAIYGLLSRTLGLQEQAHNWETLAEQLPDMLHQPHGINE